MISRWRSKKSTRDSLPEPSLNPSLSESRTGPYSWFEIEVWVIDICTNQNTKILASADWMDAKMKFSRKELEVAWSHYAKLRPYYRNRILEFLNHRREDEPGWTLCNFEIPQKWSPARLFNVRRDEQMIQITFCRPRLSDRDSSLPRDRPKIEAPGGDLPKRRASDEALEEEFVTMGTVNSTDDDVLAMNTLDQRNKIVELEKKKNGLGPEDYERLADLNDMIDYLRAQSKPDTNTTTVHEKSGNDSSREPVIIYKEFPDRKLKDIIVQEIPRDRRRHHHRHLREYGNSPEYLDDEDPYSDSRYRPRERQDSRDRREFTMEEYSRAPGPVAIRDRTRESVKDLKSQPSRQFSKETDYPNYIKGGRVGGTSARSRQSTFDRSPERRQIVIRRNERSQSRPSEKHYFSSSGSEHISPTSHVVYRERPAVDATDQSQALVLRAGASGLPYDYVRERVFNGGIRVRGDDRIGNPPDNSPGFSDDYRSRRRSLSRPAVSPYIRRPSRPSSSRRGSYRDQSWAPSLRRRRSDSSEDEESRYPSMKSVDSENNGPETELSDAEVIAQTLKQLTTIQDSDIPGTGMPAHHTRTKPELRPSALKTTSYASSDPKHQRAFSVSGRKAHFEQDIGPPQSDQDAQSGATKERAKFTDEDPFLDRITEEPDALAEVDEPSHHQRIIYLPERSVSSPTNQRTSFPRPPDLAPYSSEAHLDLSPRSTSANGPIIIEHHGYSLASQGEGSTTRAAQEEGHEVQSIRTISRNPTVDEELDLYE